MMANPFQGDDENPKAAGVRDRGQYEARHLSTAAFMKRTGTKATPPKATVGGPKIVTKEQMKKAGFDNLRDYLNAERGLTRRKDSATPKAEPAKANVEKPGLIRRTIAALGGVKLPQADYGTKIQGGRRKTRCSFKTCFHCC
jgi:hypothetical protein